MRSCQRKCRIRQTRFFFVGVGEKLLDDEWLDADDAALNAALSGAESEEVQSRQFIKCLFPPDLDDVIVSDPDELIV